MSQNSTDIFYQGSDLTPEETVKLVTEGLEGADFGEFYQEISEEEVISKDKGKYKTISVGNSSSGFGFRFGQGKRVGYSYSDTFNREALVNAIKEARQVKVDTTEPKEVKANFGRIPEQMYAEGNLLAEMSLEEKLAAIDDIEAYTKSLDKNITNVQVGYDSSIQNVHIITADGQSLTESRPLTKMSVRVTLQDENGNQETGINAIGGRVGCKDVFNPEAYKQAAERAVFIAKELLRAEEAPAGTMDVVMGNGWPAIILHEAVGHGLEGDFNRKNISVYSGKVGQKVAADEVTIVEAGNMPNTRGSAHFDDEGTPTQKNILVENGILKGYMQDRQNALLMEVEPTGNGRRESYKHTPMVRMTNTYIENGTHDPEDIIKGVKDGLYAVEFSNGQVDITSGRFNMNASLSYRIRDGKLCEPIKMASIIGDGLQVIQSIEKVGNDMRIHNSGGYCGKNGQTAIVGCGQPTILVKNLTIGGAK